MTPTAKHIRALKTINARAALFQQGRPSAVVDPVIMAELKDMGLVSKLGRLTDAGLVAAGLHLRRAPYAKPIYTGPSEKRENSERRRARQGRRNKDN